MEEQIQFYGFRGNISFPDQISILNAGLEDNANTKNKLFVGFFSNLRDKRKLESFYQKRSYYLIYINQYDNIIHCQLARKRQYNKFEMNSNNRIIDTTDEDYPYINVFIELKSQKFLIQSNTEVFENYNTCRDVIKNIMNNYFSKYDATIEINPILREEDFWNYFNGINKIYRLSFSMCTPNLFDLETAAVDFLNDIRENTGANHADLVMSNSEGNLNPHKKGINSFVEYTTAGGGTWKLVYHDENNRRITVSSTQKSYRINLSLSKSELNKKTLDEKKVNKILEAMNLIETVDNLKENKKEDEK